MYGMGASGRRPFSPDPYDPAPSSTLRDYDYYEQQQQQHHHQQDEYFNPYLNNSNNQQHHYSTNRREPSDVSVEALDLADYARTLRRNEPSIRNQRSPYPPFSPSSLPPPSLVSRGDTLTTSSHSHSSRGRRSNHRPFSLPAASPRIVSPPLSAPYRSHNYPYLNDPALTADPLSPHDDMDVSHFPAWSRSWYNSGPRSPPEDIYTPIPKSNFHTGSTKRSPFDPDATLKRPFSLPDYNSSDPYPPYAASSSHGHDSALPWSSEPPDYVNPALKEERLRMLEREFGPNATKSKSTFQDDFLDDEGKPLIGTVDNGGNMVTQGPKKRKAVRVLQILLAGLAGIPAIYAALAIKADPAPPPAGKPPAFVLYIFSVITLIALLWLFLFQPCCCSRRKSKKGMPNNPLSNGMMVLPVQGMGGKKGKKAPKGKKGKKGMPMPGGDVQVNLIVDPTAFGNNREQDEESDEYFSDDGSMPGGYGSSRRRERRRRPAPKRRSVFAGLAMEEAWKAARSRMKKMLAFDIVGVILWIAVFVYILIGQRCPSGAFEGWCNCYNTSTAAACLLAVTFCVSTFFAVKDLHSCKTSPRTRN